MVQYAGALGGTGFAAFNPTVAITGLGVHQNATLTNPAGFIDLVIGGYSTVWKGNLNQNWDTTTQNWVKSTDSSGVLYTNGDATNFDDTATTTSILISGADVSPALMSFNNSVDYTIDSAGGFKIAGTGGIIKDGSGALTLKTANTFSGGILLNSGTLNYGNASTVGTGRLTVGLNATINNTSGTALIASTNNLQTWNGDFTFTGTNDLNLGTGA